MVTQHEIDKIRQELVAKYLQDKKWAEQICSACFANGKENMVFVAAHTSINMLLQKCNGMLKLTTIHDQGLVERDLTFLENLANNWNLYCEASIPDGKYRPLVQAISLLEYAQRVHKESSEQLQILTGE